MATSFSVNVKKWGQLANLNAEQATRAATIEVFGAVIRKSPVDTGRFRGNWQVDKRGFDENKFDVSGQATLALMTVEVAKTKIGGVVSLINNLPYSERLEYGWSKQAPEGMVRLTAQEFSEAAKSAAAKVKK